ncbi:PP2C family serine/threonine-protein phosphatase [Ponticaulis sp.]|uniref:PP2C family serine/threonine-protein phosphatase n=1 Tax=Ponticaulis sp. TaxID=2020902 RepID=UPI000B72991A|nr:PP2C family serine/threonine-protein phosphatase [Ponticaulis sp.]MAI90633.1 hypothetical protein [Ponticaulis sp.]OUX99146.1 MAG: hypothetical protein CBB65_09355 [Hyphomonadaceae bacterium TMED5]|tara:strand:- start:68699 stop:69544 length:846 start_codon:yes stop_codon:yes gene_type:complete
MSISVLETINWPGDGLTAASKKVTGDDRFGFDESTGTAWVLDGATDLGPFRIFDREESDAAWIAEYLNRELMMTAPSGDVRSYFSGVLENLRKKAAKATKIDLDTAPREVWPIASGMWMWREGETTHFARLGDCVALILPPEGGVEVLTKHEQSELEARTSRELNAMSADDKMNGLRAIRARQNTEAEHVLFGLSPLAVDNLVIETRTLPEGTHVLIMSDGLWRIVDPYGMMSAQEMMDHALKNGIENLAKNMRAFERADARDTASRIKKTDDSCGVLLRF